METEKLSELSPLFAFMIGSIGTHLLHRYHGRMAKFKWSVQYQHIASSLDLIGPGDVSVSYKGDPVSQVKVALVTLINESRSDFENVNINLVANDGTMVLVSGGRLDGTPGVLPHRDEFRRAIQTPVSEMPGDEMVFWYGRSELTIPVLNRFSSASFFAVLGRNDFDPVNIAVECTHKGARCTQATVRPVFFGENQTSANWLGFLLSFAMVLVLDALNVNPTYSLYISFGLGATGVLTGILALKLWRSIRRNLG